MATTTVDRSLWISVLLESMQSASLVLNLPYDLLVLDLPHDPLAPPRGPALDQCHQLTENNVDWKDDVHGVEHMTTGLQTVCYSHIENRSI